ncbi:MAG: tetratricopeptide repeat protein [Bacteroidia bacterium]
MVNTRLAALEEMLRESPNDAFVQYAIAVELAAQNQQGEAIQRIEQLIGDQPTYLGAYYKLGKLYEEINQPEKALDVFRRGATLAQQQGNKKTLGELNEAIWMLED